MSRLKAFRDIEKFETIEAFKEMKKEIKTFLAKTAKKTKSPEAFVKKVNKFIEKKKKKNDLYTRGGVRLVTIEENSSVCYYCVKMQNPDDKVFITLDIALEL